MRFALVLTVAALGACTARRPPEPSTARPPAPVEPAPPAPRSDPGHPAPAAPPTPSEARESPTTPAAVPGDPSADDPALVARVARSCFGTTEGARAVPSPGGAYLLVVRQEKATALMPHPPLDYAIAVRATGAVTICETGLVATARWADAETVEVVRVPGTVRAPDEEVPATGGGRPDPNRYVVHARTGDRQVG